MSNSSIVTRLVGFVHGGLVFDRRSQVLADHVAGLLPENAKPDFSSLMEKA